MEAPMTHQTTLEAVGSRIREIEDQVLAERDQLLVIKRQIDFLPSRYPKPHRKTAVAIGVGIAAAVALVVLAWSLTLMSRNLTVRSGDRMLEEGEWISSTDDHGASLAFSDGSRVHLKTATGLRIRRLGRHGAHLLLERGGVEADVAHRTDTDWRIDVGPYHIAVTGTRFVVQWDPETETFHLDMREGTVDVTGPMINDGRTVSTRERLGASLKTGRLEFTRDPGTSRPLDDIASPDVSAGSTGRDAPPAPPKTRKSKDLIVKKTSPATPWQTLAEAGRYQEAVASAQKHNLSGILSNAPAVELILLGDAARHAGALPLADRVYKKTRSRFPGSAHASSAAFALGIIAFDKKGAYRNAAKWFRAIVSERAGKGSLAREASGRLMEALNRSGDRSAARDAATRYLERYPEGPHAPLAKQLTR